MSPSWRRSLVVPLVCVCLSPLSADASLTAAPSSSHVLVEVERGELARVVIELPAGQPHVIYGAAVVPFAAAPAGARVVVLQRPSGPSRQRAIIVAGARPEGPLVEMKEGREKESLSLRAPSGPFVVIAGSASPSDTGPIALAINDLDSDADGDGLGDRLEAALGTCAHAADVLANGWRCEGYPPSDTDQDGLSDADEVLGACDAHGCESLRRLGGSPRHKDVFIEADYSRAASGKGGFDDEGPRSLSRTFSAGRALEVWRVFHAAPPDVVKNPDGRPGIALHFDVAGALRLDAADNGGLLDASGGSGPVDDCREYAKKRARHMRPLRQRWFHWWCATRDVGSGQSTASALAFTARADRPGIVAHELGHGLGLGHGGRPGEPNGKASYVSLMNYGFQNWQLAFSDGGRLALNPTSLCETDGLGRGPAGRRRDVLPLAGPPYSLRVDPRRGFVDWNRDGMFSSCDEPVSASASFATFMGSDAYTTAGDVLPPGGGTLSAGLTSLALLRLEDRLFALVALSGGEVRSFSTPFPGRCPEHDPVRHRRCGQWSAPLPLEERALAVAASSTKGSAWLALAEQDAVRLYRPHVDANGALSVTLLTHVSAEGAPELSLAALDDGGALLAWRSLDGAVQLLRVDERGRQVRSGRGEPASVPGVLARHPPTGRVYLLFADARQRLALSLVLDDGERLATTPSRRFSVPSTCHGVAGCRGKEPFRTISRPALAWSGAERGHWVITHLPKESAPLHVVELRRRDVPGTTSAVGLFGNAWRRTDPDVGVRMLRFDGDERPLALAAPPKGGRRVSFFPHADGIFDATLEDHDDFERMEAGICHPFTRAPFNRPCGRPGARWRFTPATLEVCAPALDDE